MPIKFITLERLLEMRENKEPFALVEALGPDSFASGHIPEAINIPTPRDMTAEAMAKAAEEKGLSKNGVIVTYCASYTCPASTRAARLLGEAGYANVFDFKASKKGWTDAGFELEK